MNAPNIQKLSKCRACRSPSLQRFLHLPKMPFTDNFVTSEGWGSEFKEDIDIFVCKNCFTAQTQHNVDVDVYYEDYQYAVGDSALARKFMRSLAERLKKAYYPSSSKKKVLEIGSGDGEQLIAFKETNCRVLGYEPSSILCEISESKGVPTIQGLFNAASIEMLPPDFLDVDVIMLSYTFDHLPDPVAFLKSASDILNKNEGLLVVEIHNLEKIFERQEYCLFEHEHSIYLTEQTVVQLCQSAGLVVIDFDLIPESERRANSLIFIASPSSGKFASKEVQPRTSSAFSDLAFYDSVGSNIQSGIKNLEEFVDRMSSKGKKLIGYGAGGRGVMTLAAMRNAGKLLYVIDKKPKAIGLLMPKTGLPVYPIEHLNIEPVDEILVFSFGYMKEIQAELSVFGYKPHQFHSLLDVLAGRF